MSRRSLDIDRVMLGLAIIRGDGTISAANKRFCDITGYSESELMGQNIREMLCQGYDHTKPVPFDIQVSTNPLDRSYRVKSGESVWVRELITAYNETGSKSGSFMVQISDVTAEKSSLLKIRDITQRYEKLLSTMQAGIVLIDVTGKIIMSNTVAADLLDIQVDREKGRYLKQQNWRVYDTNGNLLTPEQNVASETISTGEPRTNKVRGVRLGSHGKMRWLLVNTEPIFDETGNTLQEVLITFLDITESKEAEDRIRESEQQLRTMLKDLPVAVVFVDKSANIVFSNRVMQSITGYSEDELSSLKVWELDPTYNRRKSFDEIWQQFKDKDRNSFEVEQIRKDGSRYPAEIQINSIILNNEPVLAAIILDLTGKKKRDAEKQQQERRVLQAKNYESLGVLTGGIAHDFNNILVAILGNAELAQDELPFNSSARHCVEEIQSAALAAADLCKQMLAYSGRGKVITGPLNLNHIIGSLLPQMNSSCPDSVEFTLDLAEELPDVIGDENQMKQIIKNLFANAIESSGTNQGKITIRTSIVNELPDNEWVCISDEIPSVDQYVMLGIEDTGCGMNEDTRNRLFEPFYSTKSTGRGLGMSAVLGIVRGHQGQICLKSEEGHGTNVLVLLPAVDSSTEMPVDQPVMISQESPRKSCMEPRTVEQIVLLVDDEEMVRRLATRMLKKLGYYTIHADSGEMALDILRQKHFTFAFVLLDLTMPGIGGEKTFEMIRELMPDLPVIMSSGFSETVLKTQMGDLIPDGFLQKPYLSHMLKNMIDEVMNGGRSHSNSHTQNTD